MIIIGVDEVGLGPCAGPVVVAAVALRHNQKIPGLTDSKALSDSRRRQLDPVVREEAQHWVIAKSGHRKVDRYGVHVVKRALMRACILRCVIHFRKYKIIVDGIDVPTHKIDLEMMKKADLKVPAVSAASIIAKVHRDDIMLRADARYPRYGFSTNSGYPTPQHLESLRKYGPCPIHRRSYAPVKRAMISK